MKIKINNNEIEVSEGERLIEAARRNNIEIPALCYAPGCRHQPSCMVCVVKNLTSNQILPACSTLVAEGMEIDTESEEVKQLQIASFELLLSDHIAVCRPPCDLKHCKLRQYAIAYRAKWNRFPRYSASGAREPHHIKGNLWFDVAKCIKCGLCVYNTKDGFTFRDRGFGMQVVLPDESVKNIEESISEICPTEALYLQSWKS